jgi:leader peptidase (prepilin peptidase)/N-methyltransferase
MTDTASIALATLVGAFIGSFLNVCIHRLPRGISVVWPSSSCPRCGRVLSWFENVPIFGFLVLRGRCRSCREPYGSQYLIVELVTAILFGVAWWYYGPGLLLASRLVFGCALIVLFAIDLEHHLLPNAITLPGIVAGLAFSLFTEPGWQAALTGAVAGGGVLYGIAALYYWARREEGLGMGDVKMLAMIGAFLGWQLMLVTLVMASLAGSIVGLLLIALGRGDMKYALPFGTFLAVGAALGAVIGPPILGWYLASWWR